MADNIFEPDPASYGESLEKVLENDGQQPPLASQSWENTDPSASYGNTVGGLKTVFPGWETTTVGMPGNIKSKLSQQNGVQNYDPSAVAAREPFRTGRFLVKWLKYPPFFNPLAVQYLRYLFEDCVKSVSGINDNNIDPIKITNGVTRQESTYAGIYKENNGEVTLKVPETAGSPVRKLIDYWLSGISDRKSGMCHFYGKKLRAVQPNKAGSFIYILLGPTGRPEDIEFAAMWHEVIPTSGERISMYNSDIGEAGGGVEADVTFAGIFDRGPAIDLLAKKIVTAYNLYSEGFWNAALPAYLANMYDSFSTKEAATTDASLAARLTREAEISSSANVQAPFGYDAPAVELTQNIRDGVVSPWAK